jgi:hypothetical protein
VPITNSGVAIDRKTSTLIADRPRKRCRTRANAIRVPSTVATTVARKPICTLRTTASHMSEVAHGRRQLSTVNSLKSYDSRLDGRLNDRAATTRIGSAR